MHGPLKTADIMIKQNSHSNWLTLLNDTTKTEYLLSNSTIQKVIQTLDYVKYDTIFYETIVYYGHMLIFEKTNESYFILVRYSRENTRS